MGPFEMPAFGRAALSDDEVADVTAYVTEVLQHSQGTRRVGDAGISVRCPKAPSPS